MLIETYVKNLKEVTQKKEILKALDETIRDYHSKTIPILATSASAFKASDFKSKEDVHLNKVYREAFHLNSATSMFADLYRRIPQAMVNVEYMREVAERTLPDVIVKNRITYQIANIMQLIDNVSFMSRYLRKLVETVTIFETDELGIYEEYRKDNITEGEYKWLVNKYSFFIDIVKHMSDYPKEFRKKLDEIPSIRVETDLMEGKIDKAIFARQTVDPFRCGFIPVSLNPFFYVGKWIVEFQVWRHKEAQEDLTRIQRRIILLEEARKGKSNPQIEKELSILRDKAEALSYKINKTEQEMLE